MKIIPFLFYALCFMLSGCSSNNDSDAGEKNNDSLECIMPEPATTFDTIALGKMTDELIRTIEGDLGIFLEMKVKRTGHEYYSNEWWYFDQTGKPKYFKGEWGSESLMGKYYYSFDSLGINLGFENTNNHELSDEIIRFCKKMTPYTGYRTYAEKVWPNIGSPERVEGIERELDYLTSEDLLKKTKEIMSFLASSKKSLNEQGSKFKEEKDGILVFESESQYGNPEDQQPDKEIIFLNKILHSKLVLR